jgi:thiol-disulfide isomerase/thioredoxin
VITKTRSVGALLALAAILAAGTAAQGRAAPSVFPPGTDVKWLAEPGADVDVEANLVPGKVTVVDFWAEWCLPCREVDREMAAILAAVDDVALRKIDVVDWESAVARRYLRRAEALPYVLVYDKRGKRIAVVEGLDLERLRRAVEKGRGAPLPREDL